MNPEQKLTLATANILFGGMELHRQGNSADIIDWFFVHYMVLVAKSEKFIKKRFETNQNNIVKELLDEFKHDLLVLNEVMPDISSDILELLKQAKYNLVVGETDHKLYPIARTTLIASKYGGQEFPFKIPEKAGGGAVGFEIPKLKTIVLAPHPSAFSKKIRAKQLAHIAQTVNELLVKKPEYEILVVGDFNADGPEVDSFFKKLPVTRFSHPSFPSDEIYQGLNKTAWSWIKPIMQLNEGQRSIDHVLASPGWSNPQVIPVQTSSDHVALIFKFGK